MIVGLVFPAPLFDHGVLVPVDGDAAVLSDTALGARGPVLQRSTATVELEPERTERRKTSDQRISLLRTLLPHSSRRRGHWFNPSITHQIGSARTVGPRSHGLTGLRRSTIKGSLLLGEKAFAVP
jgi:hypothetical protein